MSSKEYTPAEIQEIEMIAKFQSKLLTSIVTNRFKQVVATHATTIHRELTVVQAVGSLNTFLQLSASCAAFMISELSFFHCINLGESSVVVSGSPENELKGDDHFYAMQAEIDRLVTGAIEDGRKRAMTVREKGMDFADVIAAMKEVGERNA